jgi:hypothetical protein
MSETRWGVERGEYSDYRVVGVFSTEANARLVADALNGGDRFYAATVREWPLDPMVAELNAGRRKFKVWMYRDGSTPAVDLEDVDEEEKSVLVTTTVSGVMLYGLVWATDEKHAVKIVNERRVQLIASDEWPAD